jgi:hypothetical protein
VYHKHGLSLWRSADSVDSVAVDGKTHCVGGVTGGFAAILRALAFQCFQTLSGLFPNQKVASPSFPGGRETLALQLLLKGYLGIGGEGRNRPDFPAVAPLECLILLAIQALPALSAHIL